MALKIAVWAVCFGKSGKGSTKQQQHVIREIFLQEVHPLKNKLGG